MARMELRTAARGRSHRPRRRSACGRWRVAPRSFKNSAPPCTS